MRYLLFFLTLCYFSNFAFSQEPPHPANCVTKNFYGGPSSTVNAVANNCKSDSTVNLIKRWTQDNTQYVRCLSCAQPCVAPEVHDPITKTCVSPSSSSASSECNGQPKVYDPVSGTMVCPGSGDPVQSSSSSSQTCVVPGDFNGDCVPDDEQGSSAANSSAPTSSPASGSSGSTASAGGGGGDDGGGDNGGGGGDDGGGGNNGSGSASSSASASGGGSGSGSNSSWTPNSGYGNWIPVNPNSPCPNKYQDKDGQWWCWGGQSNSAASKSSGSAGSASSGANSSSPYGGGGECDDEPVCPEGDIECLQFIQLWHTRCGGEKIDSKFFEMEDQGDAEASFSKSFTNFKTELEKLPNTQHIQNFFQFNASGSCPVWRVDAWVFDVVIDQQCSSDIPWDLIAGVIIAVSVLLAARIALT